MAGSLLGLPRPAEERLCGQLGVIVPHPADRVNGTLARRPSADQEHDAQGNDERFRLPSQTRHRSRCIPQAQESA
jgi:hypothetical protein